VIHHIDFAVDDFARSRAFYIRLLEPLGLKPVIEFTRKDGVQLAGFGTLPDPEFWIRSGTKVRDRLHVAFLAASHEAVDAFHKAGLDAGGKDQGTPGFRPRYAENYYAAFIIDPDGHNIEAVCRGHSDPARRTSVLSA
jgi:catechol 2,3-dioxygenase-like lactoylglutathione lyase family enzyme